MWDRRCGSSRSAAPTRMPVGPIGMANPAGSPNSRAGSASRGLRGRRRPQRGGVLVAGQRVEVQRRRLLRGAADRWCARTPTPLPGPRRRSAPGAAWSAGHLHDVIGAQRPHVLQRRGGDVLGRKVIRRQMPRLGVDGAPPDTPAVAGPARSRPRPFCSRPCRRLPSPLRPRRHSVCRVHSSVGTGLLVDGGPFGRIGQSRR